MPSSVADLKRHHATSATRIRRKSPQAGAYTSRNRFMQKLLCLGSSLLSPHPQLVKEKNSTTVNGLQLCRVLRARDFCAMWVCCASPFQIDLEICALVRLCNIMLIGRISSRSFCMNDCEIQEGKSAIKLEPSWALSDLIEHLFLFFQCFISEDLHPCRPE